MPLWTMAATSSRTDQRVRLRPHSAGGVQANDWIWALTRGGKPSRGTRAGSVLEGSQVALPEAVADPPHRGRIAAHPLGHLAGVKPLVRKQQNARAACHAMLGLPRTEVLVDHMELFCCQNQCFGFRPTHNDISSNRLYSEKISSETRENFSTIPCKTSSTRY